MCILNHLHFYLEFRYNNNNNYNNKCGCCAPQADSVNADGDICVEDRSVPVQVEGPSSGSSDLCYWPTSSSLTARLRRLITAYQRSYRREQLKMEAAEKGDRRRRRCEQASKLKEIARQERQQRYVPQETCN